MPLKYHPETGLPSYVPDLGEELEEGITPKPTKITSKSDVFKGDKKSDMLAEEEGVSVYKPRKPKPTKPTKVSPRGETTKSVKAKPLRMKHTEINAGETEHQGTVATGSLTPLADAINAGVDISKEVNERLDELTAGAKPAKLDNTIATDEEVDNLERLARSQSVLHWPELVRLINRLRRAEGK